MKRHFVPVLLLRSSMLILPLGLLAADARQVFTDAVAVGQGEDAQRSEREARAKQNEAKIGREGLTLADQLRGARELRQRLWNDPQRSRYHLMPPDGFWNDINGTIYWKSRYPNQTDR